MFSSFQEEEKDQTAQEEEKEGGGRKAAEQAAGRQRQSDEEKGRRKALQLQQEQEDLGSKNMLTKCYFKSFIALQANASFFLGGGGAGAMAEPPHAPLGHLALGGRGTCAEQRGTRRGMAGGTGLPPPAEHPGG